MSACSFAKLSVAVMTRLVSVTDATVCATPPTVTVTSAVAVPNPVPVRVTEVAVVPGRKGVKTAGGHANMEL